MRNIQFFFSDIDGTILTNGFELTEESKQIVKEIIDDNRFFALASARPPFAIRPIIEELGVNIPFVSYNGALISSFSDEGDLITLYSQPIQKLDGFLIHNLLRSEFPYLSCSFYFNDEWYVERVDEWSRLETSIIDVEPELADIHELISNGFLFHKILCMGEKEKLNDLEKALESLNLGGISFYRSKNEYLEIVNSGISKKESMIFLTRKYGIDDDQTLAIGDHYNDIPMIDFSGVGIAMGNAPEGVKRHADFITTTNDENGFYKGLRKYIVNKKITS